MNADTEEASECITLGAHMCVRNVYDESNRCIVDIYSYVAVL